MRFADRRKGVPDTAVKTEKEGVAAFLFFVFHLFRVSALCRNPGASAFWLLGVEQTTPAVADLPEGRSPSKKSRPVSGSARHSPTFRV